MVGPNPFGATGYVSLYHTTNGKVFGSVSLSLDNQHYWTEQQCVDVDLTPAVGNAWFSTEVLRWDEQGQSLPGGTVTLDVERVSPSLRGVWTLVTVDDGVSRGTWNNDNSACGYASESLVSASIFLPNVASGHPKEVSETK